MELAGPINVGYGVIEKAGADRNGYEYLFRSEANYQLLLIEYMEYKGQNVMKKPMLSVVVASYNAFHLMGQCLSFFERNYRDDVELIIVDDCSNDGSYEKLEKYVQTAKANIVLLRNEVNLGPGESRNRGIDKAQGQYITFLDSDDYFTDELYDAIMPKLQDNMDLLICDYKDVDLNGREAGYSSFFSDIPEGKVKTQDAIVFLRGGTWCKFYKREILSASGIRFLPQRLAEDVAFTQSIVGYCKTIEYIKKALYCYVQVENSLVRARIQSVEHNIKCFDYIRGNLSAEFPVETEALFIIHYLGATCMNNLQLLGRKQWKLWVTEAEAMYPDYLNNPYLKRFEKIRRVTTCLIHNRCYYLLKLYVWLKPIVKKRKMR